MRAQLTGPMRIPARLAGLVPALAVAFVACEEASTATEPAVDEPVMPAFSNGATTNRETFTSPFPPNPEIESVPVSAPCLGLDAPPRMSGMWSGWFQIVLSPSGRAQITEHIDYGQIVIRTDDRTWLAGPGASEPIVLNVPASLDARGSFTVRHEFHARFISQDAEPDLRVEHRVRQLFEFQLDDEGEVVLDEEGRPVFVIKKNEFEPFTAECIPGR